MPPAHEVFTPDPTARARTISFELVFNVRDLGGLATEGGGTIRRGVLYRGDGVHRLAGADLEKARDLGLRTVVDLRTAGEIERGGQFPVAEHPVAWFHLPIIERMWSEDDLVATMGAVDFLRDRYLDMLSSGASSIARIVELVAEGTPLLFHCAAGKDRTGVVAAVLLGLAGVPADEIADDYHATAGAMAAFVDWLTVTYPNALDAMTSQPPEYLEAPYEAMETFLAEVDARYGSMAGYAKGIGVDALAIDALRAAIVDDAGRSRS
ncbi:MAG: tyrosine-protein phosphatase [Acidimicrobiales bacterium]